MQYSFSFSDESNQILELKPANQLENNPQCSHIWKNESLGLKSGAKFLR